MGCMRRRGGLGGGKYFAAGGMMGGRHCGLWGDVRRAMCGARGPYGGRHPRGGSDVEGDVRVGGWGGMSGGGVRTEGVWGGRCCGEEMCEGECVG